jgi:ornithine cyclodeaminase/alanine dehydrogenase-like protein (mu-crystallin family)
VVLDRPYVAVKVNSNFPGNPKRGLATIQGAVLLFDGRDGRLLATYDSMELTAKRTAAASALAARYLARRDSRSIAICGCGAQAPAQLEAIRRVLPIERVFAWDIDRSRAESLARAHGGTAVDDIPPADIVVTCTSAKKPFLRREQVAPGTFIAAVGADSPHKSEIDPDLFASTKVVCDLVSQAAVMGDLHHAIEAGRATAASVYAELGDLVAGRKPGRTDEREITIFDSTGVAIQDVASAAFAWLRSAASAGRK